jgi:hypothetical protein
MINRKIFFTLAASVTISGFIVICTLGQSLYRQKIEAKSARVLSDIDEADFIVREYNGKLGIFRGESASPYLIVDFSASLLSEYDRKLLAEGIAFESQRELDTFIEDITS